MVFLSYHMYNIYIVCNKSYLFTQFLFYEWQSLCLVQLLYFGDSNLILLPMFLLYKIQLNIDISKFGGPRKNFEISGCSRYPKSKFFDSISVFVFVLTFSLELLGGRRCIIIHIIGNVRGAYFWELWTCLFYQSPEYIPKLL